MPPPPTAPQPLPPFRVFRVFRGCHLAANKVDLKKTRLAIGPALRMDPASEQFIDNPKANALLTRHYRKPFVVPETV